MDNISHRAVIRYLGLKGLTPKEIHEDMVVTLEEHAPSYSIEKKWNVEIKRSRDSLEDEPRQRKLVTVTTQKTIAKIYGIIISDRRVMEYYVATELGISQDRIHSVIHNELHMSKVSARCVRKLLGPDLNRTRLNMSREQSCNFLGRSQKVSSEYCDYGLWSNQRQSNNRNSGNT